ncbi:uncharacterized protein LOC113343446 [Papaver somniferum]|uniref:uncharacterized protein LOC113343446 n=1 Tax=Papaver somniferum TaxID=3469 RepID=UPI000E6F850F|nr:uncharacterized protein LOC113343446 [Papaver somniferum]
MSLNSPDPIELNSSLDSNSVDVTDEVQSKISLDQFGSFLGSDFLENLESNLNHKEIEELGNGRNQTNKLGTADKDGDDGKKLKGIQVMEEQLSLEYSLLQVKKKRKL